MTRSDDPASAPADDAFEAHLDAAAALLGLTVEPAWRASVLGHLKATTAAARLVDAFILDDDLEPAPVFSA
jgi:hypothetical protein